MGNLTNPVSLRIKSNLYWNSTWISYIHSNYSYLLSTDYLLYSYLNWFISRKIFSNFGWLYFYSHYKLVRVFNSVFVIFFFKDYKFYRFIFEYLSVILKIVAKKRTKIFLGSRFNWYKLQKSVYKTYFSRKFVNYFKISRTPKINFLYYTCWLYTFYLVQQKYVSSKISKKKYFSVRFLKEVPKNHIFFFNIFKLSNFLNLFYFVVLLYLKKIPNLNILTISYSYYLFFRQHKDFYFYWIFCKRCVFFFKSDNNTNIILYSEFNKRSKRNKIYVFKRVVAKIPTIFRFIYQKKINILFGTSQYAQVFHQFNKFKRKFKQSNKNFKNFMIKYLTKKIKISYHKMKISHNFRDSVYPTRKNDLILDLVRCFDFNVAAYAKYTAVKKNIFFSQTFLAYHKYNANWDLSLRFFRHLAFVYLQLQRNKKFHKLRQLKLIYFKKIKILHRILFKLKQANSIFNGVSKIQKRLRIIFAAKLKCKQQYILQRFKIQNNIIIYQNKALKAGNSFFFVSLFNAVKVDTNTLDFFLQYKDVIKNQAFGTSAIKYFNKYHLIQILFQVISHVKHFVYFYYFKLYYYFYYFKFFNKILNNFRNNLVLLRKLFLLYKTSLDLNNNNNTLFTNYYASVNKKITAIKNKNAFKLKYYLKEKLASQKVGKLFSNIRFNLKNLLIYRKTIFTKYTLKYKMRILACKYKKYSKYRFIYYLLYPVNTFKRILYKYKTLRNMRIKYKYFKYVFKKNLKFFFKKYVIANKLNLVKPFIINNNIYIFYKNILLNLLIIIYLRQAKKYLFTFKNFYYHFLCRKSLLQMRNPLIDLKNLNPYKSICLFYMRQFFTQINHIYALNSNIFLTNFVKKIKMLVFYMGHNTFQNTKALAYLRDIHIEFFNYFNFFTLNLLEISKYRLYFSKYLYLLINTSSKKLKISSNTKKNYNVSYIKKKYIISSIFAIPKKINMLQKFYYVCKIRAFTNILTQRKNLLSSKLNCTVLQYAQLRYNIKKNNKFFYKNFRFFYTKNLLFLSGSINACKRIQNSFIYLNKYFIKYNFVTYYKTFRNYYKKLLTMQTYYNIADLKFIMYIWYWKKTKKTVGDILWLREQSQYDLIFFFKRVYLEIEKCVSIFWKNKYISLFFQNSIINLNTKIEHLNIILNNVLFKKKSKIYIYFTKTLCVYLYANGFLTLSFLQKKQIYLRVLSVLFYNKKYACKKTKIFFFTILSVCNILLKQNFFFVCYLYNVFFVLFKRIVYLLSYTNFFSFSFVESYNCFKRVFKQEYFLKYHIYYKNIYLKKKNFIMYNTNTTSKNIFKLVKSNNLNICFLQYNTVSRLYKKLRYRSLKKRNIKNKKKKFYTNKKNIYIIKKNNKRRYVNKFLKFKCVNLKKKKSSIYLKTLRKCFNFKSAVLKSIIQKKNKLLIKKKIKKKTRVVLKKQKKTKQKVKKNIKSKKKNKNLSNNNDFNKKK